MAPSPAMVEGKHKWFSKHTRSWYLQNFKGKKGITLLPFRMKFLGISSFSVMMSHLMRYQDPSPSLSVLLTNARLNRNFRWASARSQSYFDVASPKYSATSQRKAFRSRPKIERAAPADAFFANPARDRFMVMDVHVSTSNVHHRNAGFRNKLSQLIHYRNAPRMTRLFHHVIG